MPQDPAAYVHEIHVRLVGGLVALKLSFRFGGVMERRWAEIFRIASYVNISVTVSLRRRSQQKANVCQTLIACVRDETRERGQ